VRELVLLVWVLAIVVHHTHPLSVWGVIGLRVSRARRRDAVLLMGRRLVRRMWGL